MTRAPSKSRPQAGGFTILELLIAMALLSALGVFLVSLVKNSFDMYTEGDRRADLYQTGIHVLSQLEDDLKAVHAGPEGRLLLFGYGSQGAGDGGGFLLRLVRSIPNGESRHPHLRNAGTATGAAGIYTGEDPGIGKRKELAPPTGLIEVAYALVQQKDDPTGLLTLYRGVRAPALAAGGFFDESAAGGFDEKWARQNLKPLATDILGLWVLCFGQESEEWLEEEVLNGRTHKEGSLTVWDSTRGILGPSVFALAVSPASLTEPRDDVFPRKIMLVAQVARSWSPDAVLRRTLGPMSKEIAVNTTAGFPRADPEQLRYIKIGDEWLQLGEIDGSGARVLRHRRMSRTPRKPVPAGTPVFVGRVFRKTIDLPVRRSNWLEAGR